MPDSLRPEYSCSPVCSETLTMNNMPQLLFQDRRDTKRASVELLPYYLVDFRRTLDAKTSLRLIDSETNI